MINLPHHAILVLNQDHLSRIHSLDTDEGKLLTWQYIDDIAFDIQTSEKDYMIKLKLNCYEGAFIKLSLINDEMDQFNIELYEKADVTSIVSLFHDVSNH